MAFARRLKSKKRMFHKKGKLTLKRLSNQVKSVTKKTSPELKYNQDFFDGATSAAGANLLLSGISQGTGVNNRVGDKIKSQAITFNYQLINADVHPQVARVILFRWLDDSVPTAAQVLQLTFGANLTNANYQYLYKTRMFKILYDKVHTFGPSVTAAPPAVTASDHMQIQSVHKNIKLRGDILQFDGAGVNTGIYGKIYMLNISSSANVALNFYWTYSFTDV